MMSPTPNSCKGMIHVDHSAAQIQDCVLVRLCVRKEFAHIALRPACNASVLVET